MIFAFSWPYIPTNMFQVSVSLYRVVLSSVLVHAVLCLCPLCVGLQGGCNLVNSIAEFVTLSLPYMYIV